MIQALKLALYIGCAFAYAPLALVAALGDALTDGKLTGRDYIDPYDPDKRHPDKQYIERPGGGYWTKDQMP